MRSDARFIATVLPVLMIAFTVPIFADDLALNRQRASSDDAETIQEASFHGTAKALVIKHIQTNKLGVGGKEFRVKRNPVGKGCFVYDPRTRFYGVKRNLVWWAVDEGTAYALNSPSKMVTPSLKWPRDDGLDSPSTGEIVGYVFESRPISPPKPVSKVPPTAADSFTVKEYRIYRSLIDTPMSVPEAQALQNVGKRFGVTAAEAKKIARKIQDILFRNEWYGSSDAEIKHATDWKSEKP
jgi:hypothetical protein